MEEKEGTFKEMFEDMLDCDLKTKNEILKEKIIDLNVEIDNKNIIIEKLNVKIKTYQEVINQLIGGLKSEPSNT